MFLDEFFFCNLDESVHKDVSTHSSCRSILGSRICNLLTRSIVVRADSIQIQEISVNDGIRTRVWN